MTPPSGEDLAFLAFGNYLILKRFNFLMGGIFV